MIKAGKKEWRKRGKEEWRTGEKESKMEKKRKGRKNDHGERKE